MESQWEWEELGELDQLIRAQVAQTKSPFAHIRSLLADIRSLLAHINSLTN